jgi:hypothetical protein
VPPEIGVCAIVELFGASALVASAPTVARNSRRDFMVINYPSARFVTGVANATAQA